MSNVPKLLPWFLSISLPLYLIDQLTKWWVVLKMEQTLWDPVAQKRINAVEVIENVFWISRVHNQGMAWGIGNGSAWAPLIFPFILTTALVAIVVFWKKNGFPTTLTKVAAVLVLAGILGNFTDRLVQGFFLPAYAEESFWVRFTQGYVVDFLDFRIPVIEYDYPTFNVADSCICTAAVLLIYSALFSKEYRAS